METNTADAVYEAASNTFTTATLAYNEVAKAYRARLIGDAEYLVARSTWKRAEAVYDAAFTVYNDQPEPLEVVVESAQLSLL